MLLKTLCLREGKNNYYMGLKEKIIRKRKRRLKKVFKN